MSEATFTPELFVFIGQRLDRNNKPSDLWLPIKGKNFPLPDMSAAKWFKVNLIKGASCGAVFSIPTLHIDGIDSKTTVRVSEAEYIDRWDNKEDVIGWEIAHRLTKSKLASQKQFAKEMRNSPLLDSLKPIKDAYWSSNLLERELIIASVIREITAPVSHTKKGK